MKTDQLYTAILTRPIDAKRLEKAKARADTPAIWAEVLDRLRAEGRLPEQAHSWQTTRRFPVLNPSRLSRMVGSSPVWGCPKSP